LLRTRATARSAASRRAALASSGLAAVIVLDEQGSPRLLDRAPGALDTDAFDLVGGFAQTAVSMRWRGTPRCSRWRARSRASVPATGVYDGDVVAREAD
jgi:hypothetical protein